MSTRKGKAGGSSRPSNPPSDAPAGLEGEVCLFCRRGPEGQHARLLITPSGKRYHAACIGYSSSLELQLAIDRRAEQGRKVLTDRDVEGEWERCSKLPCSVCCQLGATLTCAEEGCGQLFHFPCARTAALGRWQGGRVTFSAEQRNLACPKHSVGKPLSEPRGFWFEDCGGWNGSGGAEATGAAAGKQVPVALLQPAAVEEAQQTAAEGASTAQQQHQRSQAADPPKRMSLYKRWNKTTNNMRKQGAAAQQQGSGAPGPSSQQPQGPSAGTAAGTASTSRSAPVTAAPSAIPAGAGAGGSNAAAAAVHLGPAQDAPASKEKPGKKWHIPGHEWELKGCISRPVPLRPGEIRVLGHTLMAELAGPYKQVTKRYKALMATKPKNYPSVRIVAPNIPNASKCEQSSQRRKYEQAFVEYLTKACGGKLAPENLPEELPVYEGCEIFSIRPDDPRVGLARQPGALGLRNCEFKKGTDIPNEPIPPYTVLGPYQCLQARQFDVDSMVRDEELMTKMNFPHSGALALALESYAADSTAHDEKNGNVGKQQRELLLEEVPRLGNINHIVYLAFAYGNETALINDLFTDPLGDLAANENILSKAMTDNCWMVEVFIFGWPFTFLITHGFPVPPGDELVTTYEDLYWVLYSKTYWIKLERDQEYERLQRVLQQQSGGDQAAQPTGSHMLVTQASGVNANGGAEPLAGAAEASGNRGIPVQLEQRLPRHTRMEPPKFDEGGEALAGEDVAVLAPGGVEQQQPHAGAAVSGQAGVGAAGERSPSPTSKPLLPPILTKKPGLPTIKIEPGLETSTPLDQVFSSPHPPPKPSGAELSFKQGQPMSELRVKHRARSSDKLLSGGGGSGSKRLSSRSPPRELHSPSGRRDSKGRAVRSRQELALPRQGSARRNRSSSPRGRQGDSRGGSDRRRDRSHSRSRSRERRRKEALLQRKVSAAAPNGAPSMPKPVLAQQDARQQEAARPSPRQQEAPRPLSRQRQFQRAQPAQMQQVSQTGSLMPPGPLPPLQQPPPQQPQRPVWLSSGRAAQASAQPHSVPWQQQQQFEGLARPMVAPYVTPAGPQAAPVPAPAGTTQAWALGDWEPPSPTGSPNAAAVAPVPRAAPLGLPRNPASQQAPIVQQQAHPAQAWPAPALAAIRMAQQPLGNREPSPLQPAQVQQQQQQQQPYQPPVPQQDVAMSEWEAPSPPDSSHAHLPGMAAPRPAQTVQPLAHPAPAYPPLAPTASQMAPPVLQHQQQAMPFRPASVPHQPQYQPQPPQQGVAFLSEWEAPSPPASPRAAGAEGGDTPDVMLNQEDGGRARGGTPELGLEPASGETPDHGGRPDHELGGTPDQGWTPDHQLDGAGHPGEEPPTPDLNDMEGQLPLNPFLPPSWSVHGAAGGGGTGVTHPSGGGGFGNQPQQRQASQETQPLRQQYEEQLRQWYRQ